MNRFVGQQYGYRWNFTIIHQPPCIHSISLYIVYLLNKYLLSAHYMSDTLLDARKLEMDKSKKTIALKELFLPPGEGR